MPGGLVLLERSPRHGQPQPGEKRTSDGDAETKRHGEERLDPWVRCAQCGARLTPSASAIDVDGAQQHTFVNPSFELFEIRCFSRAPGARVSGPASAYWSWFEGFSWEIAVCAECWTHIGWRFSGAGPSFFGLIVKQLSESR